MIQFSMHFSTPPVLLSFYSTPMALICAIVMTDHFVIGDWISIDVVILVVIIGYVRTLTILPSSLSLYVQFLYTTSSLWSRVILL